MFLNEIIRIKGLVVGIGLFLSVDNQMIIPDVKLDQKPHTHAIRRRKPRKETSRMRTGNS